MHLILACLCLRGCERTWREGPVAEKLQLALAVGLGQEERDTVKLPCWSSRNYLLPSNPYETQ